MFTDVQGCKGLRAKGEFDRINRIIRIEGKAKEEETERGGHCDGGRRDAVRVAGIGNGIPP